METSDVQTAQRVTYKLLCSLLHNVQHGPNSVTLLQAFLVTLELISEVFDNQPL